MCIYTHTHTEIGRDFCEAMMNVRKINLILSTKNSLTIRIKKGK